MALTFYICFYHDKRTYRSANQAFIELKKINNRNEDTKEGVEQLRVFFCDRTGGYHHTSITQSEMNRRQAKKAGGNGKTNHQNFQGQRRRQARNPMLSPKKQNQIEGLDA